MMARLSSCTGGTCLRLARFIPFTLVFLCGLANAHDDPDDVSLGMGVGWVGGLIHALQLSRAPHPADPAHWMANTEACGIAVNRTLQSLADEYLDHNVDLVLEAACEHFSVHRWFGGEDSTCRPHFENLEAEFDGSRDYSGWCEETLMVLASGTGAVASAGVTAVEEGVQEDVNNAAYEVQRADTEVKSSGSSASTLQEEMDRLRDELRQLNNDASKIRDADRRDQLRRKIRDLEKRRKSLKGTRKGAEGGNARYRRQSGDAVQMEDEHGSVGAPLSPGGAGEGMGSSDHIDVDIGAAEQAFGGVGPFGTEEQGQKLTDGSVAETNEMVEQIERAEVAEEKRSVYRALTRLRGVAISSFDGIAHAHTANIDHYAQTHKWRDSHPMRHLADEESNVESWAFPSA